MNRFTKVLAAIMLILAVVVAAGCKKPDDPTNPNNGGNNEGGGNGGDNPTPTVPTEEGMYLGIIGFNEQLYQKDISLLNSSTKQDFISFINNLQQEDLTALYYADYTGLKKLQSYPEPPKLSQVALVTFTDGLDNISTSNNVMDPEGYGSVANYRAGLYNLIMGEQVYGKDISAYSIGLKGEDVQNNLAEFTTNINMLASSPQNVFDVDDMDEALESFEYIANTLYTKNTMVNLKLKVPGGIDDGTIIRFTFDNVPTNTHVENSTKYIQATYNKTANNGRSLTDISYHGFEERASSMTPVSQSDLGTYHWFEFEDLKLSNVNNTPTPISQNEISQLQLWKKQGTTWQKDLEFKPDSSSEVIETRSSALIMLVLDCTTSLGDDFKAMQDCAVRFVETLVSSSGNGNNGGGGNGGGNTPPNGIINGKFSVSASQKVYFSKGNLQYQPSTNTWQFANHQYEYIGNDNNNIDQYYNGWIDLFGWGTSGFMHQTCYQPYSTSQFYNDYQAYGASNSNLYDQTGLADWGVNAISNGGNQTRVWRTLTKDEWAYLLQNRSTSSGIHYAKAKVKGKNGILLLPDDWNGATTINNADDENAPYNEISSTDWSILQSEGAVFLPAAGSRDGTSVSGADASGYYWSSSCYNEYFASLLSFNNSSLSPYQNDYKYYGQSVRLVCEVK